MMYKRLIFLIAIVIPALCTLAQSKGEITEDNLNKYRMEFEAKKDQLQPLQNAVVGNEIKKVALNAAKKNEMDTYFSHRVKSSGVTDQKSSGRCWLFTAQNIFRPMVMEKFNIRNFEFSQTYSFFYDQLEKSNLFLESIIVTSDRKMDDRMVEWLFKHPMQDGGQWATFADLTIKYGMVPKSVMPETYSSEHTRMMSRLLTRKLREYGLELREMHAIGDKPSKIREAKQNMLSSIYQFLAINLGEPTTEFSWRYEDKNGNISEPKTYTPQSFFSESVGRELNDYVMFMDDPTREYNKLYEIDLDRNLIEGGNWKFINLPVAKLKEMAIQSIKDDEGMYFSCDVGKELYLKDGILDVGVYDYGPLFGMDFSMDKKERIMTFESGSTHGMALMGVDLDESGTAVKWLLENSWGPSDGFKGHLIMSDKWFDEYFFRLVIHKRFVSGNIMEILETEPIKLPPWDPMFMNEQ